MKKASFIILGHSYWWKYSYDGEIKDECVFQQHLKPEESVDDYIEPQMPSITPISLDIYSTMADFEEGLREAADMIKELRTK